MFKVLVQYPICIEEFVMVERIIARLEAVHFFFFQAEDGIRDSSVTGVQTCALPILMTIFVSVALGSTLRAAERIARLNSFLESFRPCVPSSPARELRITLYDSCETSTAFRHAFKASGDCWRCAGSTKVALVSSWYCCES